MSFMKHLQTEPRCD